MVIRNDGDIVPVVKMFVFEHSDSLVKHEGRVLEKICNVSIFAQKGDCNELPMRKNVWGGCRYMASYKATL